MSSGALPLPMLARVAFRGLARHRVKTVITVLAITVSVTVYIAIDAWLLGTNQESRRNIVGYETGAAKLQSAAYFGKKDELPMYENFEGWERYAAALSLAGYDSAPRFVFTGTLYSSGGSAPAEFDAIDVESEPRVLRYPRWIESGRFIRPGVQEIALGSLTAEKLKTGIPQRPKKSEFEELLETIADSGERSFAASLYERQKPRKASRWSPAEELAGDEYRLMLKKNVSGTDIARLWDILAATGRMDLRIATVIDIKDENGKIAHVNQILDVVLAGVINSPDPKNNVNIAYIPLDALQDEAGLMLEGRVTELLIRAKGAGDSALPGKTEKAAVIRAALERELGGPLPGDLAVYGWFEYVADYIAVSTQDNITSRVMSVMLFILSFLGIANTMLMAILERTKETGMMRALGMTNNQLIITYMLEAGFAGALGSLFGVIAGCLINIPMVSHGVDFSDMIDRLDGDIGYRVASLMRSAWNVPVIIGSAVVATALSACAAFLPVRRTLKMPVIDSLRFE